MRLVQLAALLALAAPVAGHARTLQVCLSGTTATAMPALANRRAVEIYNADTVTVCCAQGSITATYDCRPIASGASWALNVTSGYTITCKAESAMTGSTGTGGCLRYTEVQ